MLKKMIHVVISLFFCLNLAGCYFIPVYKQTIQQGNIITPDMIAQVKPGMTEQQVRFVMGNPVMVNTFNPHRWDYVYSLKSGGKKPIIKRVTLTFENGKLVTMSP